MRVLSSVVALTSLIHLANGQVLSSSQIRSPHEQRRQAFLELSRSVFAAPGVTDAERRKVNSLQPADADKVTAQLHNLVSEEIGDVLSASNPSARDIIDAVQDLLGETSLPKWGAQFSNTPFAEFSALNGVRMLVISYGILRGGGALPNTHSYLEFYEREATGWQPKASANLVLMNAPSLSRR